MNSRREEALSQLPAYLGGHMLVTVSALLLGILISVPIGIFASRRPKFQPPLLTVASLIQTIPGLAMLALMVPLLGMIGFWPAFIALTLYSILPTLRNTVTGIAEVDNNLVEAARGVGMTDLQVLRIVQLPLALPVIVAGVRTAAVWVVGMATLSTPVGWTSLGNYIFSGLQTNNQVAILFGCASAALLAIVIDQLVRLSEVGLRKRRHSYVITAAAGILAIFSAGLAHGFINASSRDVEMSTRPRIADDEESVQPAPRGTIVIGSKPFTEQYILSDFIAGTITRNGFTGDVRENMGSTVLFDAIAANNIDCYVDYTGTLWATILQRNDSLPPESIQILTASYLLEQHGVVMLGPLGFENAYCLAMRKDQAKELGIRSISDLAQHASELTVGSDYEFFGRSEWQTVRDRYDLSAMETRTMDPALMYEAVRKEQVDVISAYSTDGRIVAYDLVVLDDPLSAFPPYDAVLLLSPKASENRALVKALRPLLHSISDNEMRNANKLVDTDGKTPAAAAAWLGDQMSR
jgi:osmoprotectant transport system permease protein